MTKAVFFVAMIPYRKHPNHGVKREVGEFQVGIVDSEA
jgi:hypothetical protein